MEVGVLGVHQKVGPPRRGTLVTLSFEIMLCGMRQRKEVNPAHGGESNRRPLRKARISKASDAQYKWE